VFSQFLTWRWIFFVNVPLCIVAIVLLVRVFHEKIEPKRHRVDYLGAGLLTASLSLLILAVLEGGQAWAWSSVQSIGAFTLGGLLLAGFVIAEKYAAEPVLPLWVFSRRLLLTTAFVSLGVGAILIGLTSYVPTYLEHSLGAPPLVAGLTLAVLTLGWPISASQSGRLYLRIGFRNTALIGMSGTVAGTLVLALTSRTPSIAIVAASCFVIGLGMGLVATPTLIAAQASVPWGERGVVTGTNLFSRSIGSAVGVAIFGAVANGIFQSIGGSEKVPSTVEAAAGSVFIAVAIAALATVAAAVAMPRTPVEQVAATDSDGTSAESAAA
jgi:Na+/melibiose symporter-like transporter